MGLEAYLFEVEFINGLEESEIVDAIESAGMSHLINKQSNQNGYRDYYFEIRTSNGLTEAHCLLAPGDTEIKDFSLRFSIMSPKMVVDQTFDLLKDLNRIHKIKLFDTEIKNHIYRQLRIDGKVDDWFVGLEGTEEEAKIEKQCYIPIDADSFKSNDLGIEKRRVVLSNDKGAIIESGSATFNLIEKKGLFDKFIGWIKKEL